MHTKAKISSGLVTWCLNGPCESTGFLIIETNRNKQLTEVIMKKDGWKDAGAESHCQEDPDNFPPALTFNAPVAELRAWETDAQGGAVNSLCSLSWLGDPYMNPG